MGTRRWKWGLACIGKHTLDKLQNSLVIMIRKNTAALEYRNIVYIELCMLEHTLLNCVYSSILSKTPVLPVLQGFFSAFLFNTHMCGCTGKKSVAKICNNEDVCPNQQLTGITCSFVPTSQCRKWEFYAKFWFHFTLSQLRKRSQTAQNPNHRRSTSSSAGNRSEDFLKSFSSLPFVPLSLSGSAVWLSCSPGSAQTLPRGEPESQTIQK